MIFKLYDKNSNPNSLKQMKCIDALYILSLVIIGIYIAKYNIQYKQYQYNPIIVPGFLLYSSMPLIHHKIRNDFFTKVLLYIIPCFYLIFLTWTAGGLLAPGVFWLSAVPLTAGIFFGRSGYLVGSLTLVGSIALFTICDHFKENPNFIKELGLYEEEKKTNILLFLIYSSIVAYYYISLERKLFNDLESSNREVESLLRILIHDVSTPLTIIQMEAQKLRKTNALPHPKTLLRLERSTNNLSSIILHARNYKSLKDGKSDLRLKSLDLNQEIHEVLDTLKPKFEEKQIQVICEIHQPSLKVLAFENYFKTVVLTNILTNGIKFSDLSSKIIIRVTQENNFALIHIKDSGIGIPPRIQKEIFLIHKSTTRTGTLGEKGTGYGMPLVKEYIDKMQGQISITSLERGSDGGKSGTNVYLRLKLA